MRAAGVFDDRGHHDRGIECFRLACRLRAHLLAARKARDTVRVSTLRSALAAIDNAETPDSTGAQTVVGGGPGDVGVS